MDRSIFGKDKRKLLYVRNMSGISTVFRKKYLKPNVVKVGMKEKMFVLDYDKPLFRSKNTFFYLVDIDNGQLSVANAKVPQKVSPEMTHAIVKNSLVKQLITRVDSGSFTDNWLMMLILITLGGSIGYIFGKFF